jgi:hypothetical protein
MKRIVHIVCLTLSIFLSIQFFFDLSPDLFYRVTVCPIVTAIEWMAQYILSLARRCWRKRRIFQALLLSFVYACYLLVFAFLSGMSYFVTELATTEYAAFVQETTRLQWEQNNAQLEILHQHLLTESKTGYGRQSREIMEEIKLLEREQRELEEWFATKKPIINKFTALSTVLGLSAELLKALSFGVAIGLLYVGLTITNPDIKARRRKRKRRSIDQAQDKKRYSLRTRTKAA